MGTATGMEPVERDGVREPVLVGVFADHDQANRVAADLAAKGIERSAIRVNAHVDDVASLRGEMRDELTNAVPGVASLIPFSKETTKGAVSFAVLGAIVGAVLVSPLSLVSIGELPWWARLLVVACIGALAGAVVGAVAGGSLAAKGPGDPLAAQRGVTVSVSGEIERARSVMVQHDPIRVDLIDGAQLPVDVVDTDEASTPGTAEDVARNVDKDDYQREKPPGASDN